MPIERFIFRLYAFASTRRTCIFSATAIFLSICLLGLWGIELREDIKIMLPEAVAGDFDLLRLAPFSHKILITVRADEGVDFSVTADAVKSLAKSMGEPYFSGILTGPPRGMGPSFLLDFLAESRNLFTERNARDAALLITPENVAGHLQRDYRTLISPQGLAMKHIIQADPLSLRSIMLQKLAAGTALVDMKVKDGLFTSKDGQSALIIADTPVSMTDSKGSAAMLDNLKRLTEALPSGVKVSVVCGHRYAKANAERIRLDLKLILPLSITSLIALYFIYFRSRKTLFLIAMPLAATCVAMAMTGRLFDGLSGIVVGFGAVLLGISIDFGIHVFFALKEGGGEAGERLGLVARPILCSGLTSLAAFGALLSADIPGIRQLAIFSMSGLLTAMILSLVVLPLLFKTGDNRDSAVTQNLAAPCAPCVRRVICFCWIMFLLTSLYFASGLRVDGDLRNLGYVTDEIRKDEADAKRIWGDVRNKTVLFAQGRSMDEALGSNSQLYELLCREYPEKDILSLAPILPNLARQAENSARWDDFWGGPGRGLAAILKQESRDYGFSDNAFLPFFALLKARPAALTLDVLPRLGLLGLSDLLITKDGDKFIVMTMLPDIPPSANILSEIAAENARLISPSGLRLATEASMMRSLTRFALTAFIAVSMLLWLFFRNVKKTIAAALPIITGVFSTLGVMGAAGLDFNLYTAVAIPLVIGLGADYGAFIVCDADNPNRATRKAVLISGLSTLAGLGILALARHPALGGIGLAVLCGIAGALPTALFVIPAMLRGRG